MGTIMRIGFDGKLCCANALDTNTSRYRVTLAPQVNDRAPVTGIPQAVSVACVSARM